MKWVHTLTNSRGVVGWNASFLFSKRNNFTKITEIKDYLGWCMLEYLCFYSTICKLNFRMWNGHVLNKCQSECHHAQHLAFHITLIALLSCPHIKFPWFRYRSSLFIVHLRLLLSQERRVHSIIDVMLYCFIC